MKQLFCYILLFFAMFVAAEAQEYRDVVFLKNGSVIKGFYRELYPEDSLRLETIDGGVLVCAMSDIDRIAKEKCEVYLVDMGESYKHDDNEWRKSGYRGTIEYGQNVNTDDNRLHVSSIFTTHGYQASRYLYVGLGAGLEQITYTIDNLTLTLNNVNIPVFGETRLFLGKGSIVPVLDARLGYTVVGYKGLYFNPSIGVDFSLSPRCGLFLLAGYFLQEYVLEQTDYRSNNVSFHIGFHF